MTATATPSLTIKDKGYYSATIKDQQLVFTGKEENQIPTLILTCSLTGELIDSFDPDKGTVAAPKLDVDVMFRFDPSGNMDMTLDHLARLGFTGDDLEQLGPDHKKHHSFVGTVVTVSATKKMKNDREVTYWNLRFPKKFQNRKVGKGELTKSATGEFFRELMARRKAEAAGQEPF